jgi:hypothetical protein
LIGQSGQHQQEIAMRYILVLVAVVVIGLSLVFGIGSAAAQDSTPSLVARQALQVCPTAASPEQCIVDFASVIAEARLVVIAEVTFRRQYPDPKSFSIDVYKKEITFMKRWTQILTRHDRRWAQ